MLTESFFVVLASLLKGDSPFPGNLFIAVGAGQAAWDQTHPDYDRAVKKLANEVARKAVRSEDVVFLDADGEETSVPSPRLRVRATFEASEGIGTLRECGLFGGGATSEKDSGTLLVYYTHPRLEKTSEMMLERSLHIDLTPKPYAPGTRVTRYLGNSRAQEFHDLHNLAPGCQVDEIRFDYRVYLGSIEQATSLGYDYCAYCFGPELSKQ